MPNPIAIADLMDRRAPRKDVLCAIGFVAFFAAITLAAVAFGDTKGPAAYSFVPICATLWGAADLLTAYLLLTQFSVNGMQAFAVLGAAYAIPGVLTIGYLAFFPNVFFMPPVSAGVAQISLWLWVAWHIAFPLIVGGYHIIDRDLRLRVGSAVAVHRWMAGAIAASGIACALILAVVIGGHDRLPIMLAGGGFTSLFTWKVAPIVVAVNLAAAIAILGSKRPSRLQLWLSVAVFIAALDATLNAVSNSRFSISWYVGKLETLATATVIIMILLTEVSALYRRLGDLATIDALTGLSNRQSFDSNARFALETYRRGSSDLSFLVVDIDFFKQYNDTYGHQAGDVCLQAVANSVRRSCTRSVDLVGRFGGEEFVVLLPGTNAAGASKVAETVRAGVEALGIAHANSSVAAVVTVSVGAAQVASETEALLETLFRRADAALYRAKVTRNTVVTADALPDQVLATDTHAVREHLVPDPAPQAS